jgi:type IV pilus assembly protein PilW
MKKITCSASLPTSGFSIIEILISTVIMLITSIALVEIVTTFKNQQKNTYTNNEITQSALYGIAKLDQSIRDAGHGFKNTWSISYGCPIRAFRNNINIYSSLPAPFNQLPTTANLTLAPVLIIDGGTDSTGGALSDMLIAMSGSNSPAVLGTKLTATSTTSSLSLNSTTGFEAGNQILLVANDQVADPLAPCLVDQVAAVGSYPINTLTLSNSFTLPPPENIPNQFHSNSPFLTGYAVDSVVVNLGNQPQFILWGIDNNATLVSLNLLSQTSPVIESIAEDIVSIQARYGIDSTPMDNDQTIDAWIDATQTHTPDFSATTLTDSSLNSKNLLQSIKAIRIALVFRKKSMEIQSVPNTTALTPSLTVFEDLTPLLINIPPAEQKYGYRIFETTIFLRNNTNTTM